MDEIWYFTSSFLYRFVECQRNGNRVATGRRKSEFHSQPRTRSHLHQHEFLTTSLENGTTRYHHMILNINFCTKNASERCCVEYRKKIDMTLKNPTRSLKKMKRLKSLQSATGQCSQDFVVSIWNAWRKDESFCCPDTGSGTWVKVLSW